MGADEIADALERTKARLAEFAGSQRCPNQESYLAVVQVIGALDLLIEEILRP